MKRVKQLIYLAVLLCLLSSVTTGCGSSVVEAGYVASDLVREDSPVVPIADIANLSEGNTEFAFDLYRQLVQEGKGNMFYSPFSISMALAMAYAGAEGETASEMASVMHYTLPEESLHPAFNAVDQLLESRGEGAQGADGEGFRLNVVNALWGQDGYAFEQAFLDTLAQNYGAGLRILDFAKSEAARKTINDWVSDKTEERIQDLIPEGALGNATRLVLTNAIYFNAAWEEQFEESSTVDKTFTLLDSAEIEVPMMRNVESFGYGRGKGYQVVELPYDGHQLAMDVILPDAGTFEDFEANLSGADLTTMLANIDYQMVRLAIPKFEMESEFSLSEALQAMGMQTAFGPDADFSGMDGKGGLFISDVLHKSFVKVDESGTEAAAATAVIMAESAMEIDEPIEVTVDRPFIFVIRDLETNTILFVGRIVNPE